MADTTDVAQPTDDPGTTQPASPRHQSSRLNQALAWVGIVAGGVFVVAAIFLSGFFLNWSEHAHMRMGMGDMATAHESKDCCADMKPGEMKPGEMKPGEMKPGAMGPEMMGPEMMGPHSGR
jgi:hypothetical protein